MPGVVRALPWLAVAAGFCVVGYLAATGKPTNRPVTTEQFVAAKTTALKGPAAHRKTAATRPRGITIRAARGDCWIDAHAGSATGRVLYYSLLRRGRTLRLRAPRVWVRFGFAPNVDVRVDGRPRPLSKATSSLVLSSRPG
jgi:RodZ C-terminal domain